MLLAPPLTVREAEIAEIGCRLRRTVEALHRDDSLPVFPTAGPETPDPRKRADVVLLAPPLTVREAEIAEIGRRRRTFAALRRDGSQPAGA